MKIGDEVYVHGYVDEIRNDVVIIRNDGGYFGTVPTEIVRKDEPQTEISTISEKLQLTKCDLCKREGDDICLDCERKKRSGKE